jgi:zinc protease
VSANELATAKSIRIRGYAQQFESLQRIAQQITDFWSLGLPMSDLKREPAELEKATLTSVNAVAEKYATPSRAILLLVGDASKIEPGVRDLKLGEVVSLDAEGRPVQDKAK